MIDALTIFGVFLMDRLVRLYIASAGFELETRQYLEIMIPVHFA
jgi:hypothetical protein